MPETDKQREERMKWWLEARFGMFIHWGIYSVLGRGEWAMNRERIPVSEYEELADEFRPTEYNSGEWAHMAASAGMKYMVMTAKHHDGFCMWDAAGTEFCATRTGAGRDYIGEYVEACRRHGLKVGIYYSWADWHHPDYMAGMRGNDAGHRWFIHTIHGHIRELMTKYGKIDILWYDGPWPYDAEGWKSERINREVRELQPHILINNRCHLPEDFETPEQHITPSERPWEACMTMCDSWGYHAGDANYKSADNILRALVKCCHGGGNLLLNVGPRPDGSFPEEAVERLHAIGRWMKTNSESIYSTTRSPFEWSNCHETTVRGKHVYLHADKWPGTQLCVTGIANKVSSAVLLAGGAKLTFRQAGDRLFIRGLPLHAMDRSDTVIRLTVQGTPEKGPEWERMR